MLKPSFARHDLTALTDAMVAFLRDYGAGHLPGARVFTLANWPEAAGWSEVHATALGELGRELGAAAVPAAAEWLASAAWLASAHHQNDPAQQKRVITGNVLRRAMEVTRGGWRDRYRDSRHLSETVQAILERAPAAGARLAAPFPPSGRPGSPGRPLAFPGVRQRTSSEHHDGSAPDSLRCVET